MDEGLGSKFCSEMIGVILGVTVAAVLIFILVSSAWYRWGAIGAFVFFGGVLLLISWFADSKKRKEWEDDDE